MAAPITWRNVGAQGNRDALYLLGGAQQSFNGGFDALNRVMEQHKETNQANWENTRQNNTQNFLDQLSQYRTPEEFQQAQASGALDQIRAGYGNQIDRGAARTALDTRGDTLRQRAGQQAQYDDTMRDRAELPQINEAMQLAARGDDAGARAILDQHEFRNEGALSGQLFDLRRSHAGERRAQAGESRAQAGESRAQENQAWNRTARGRQQTEWSREDAANEIMRDALQGYQQEAAHQRDGLATIAGEMNIPVKNGMPDLSGASEKQIDAFDRRRQELGFNGTASDSVLSQAVIRRMREEGVPETMIAQSVASLGQGLAGQNALAPTDQSALDERTAQFEKQYKTKSGELERDYKARAGSNPFVTPSQDPYTDASKVVAGAKGLEDRGVNPGKLVPEVASSMAEGVSIPDGQGGSVKIQVTPGMAEMALQQVKAPWLGRNLSYEEAIKDIVSQPDFLKRYREGSTLHQTYQQEQSALDRKYLGTLASDRARFREERGLPGTSVNNLLDALEKRRKP